jgi:hypothetical protein
MDGMLQSEHANPQSAQELYEQAINDLGAVVRALGDDDAACVYRICILVEDDSVERISWGADKGAFATCGHWMGTAWLKHWLPLLPQECVLRLELGLKTYYHLRHPIFEATFEQYPPRPIVPHVPLVDVMQHLAFELKVPGGIIADAEIQQNRHGIVSSLRIRGPRDRDVFQNIDLVDGSFRTRVAGVLNLSRTGRTPVEFLPNGDLVAYLRNPLTLGPRYTDAKERVLRAEAEAEAAKAKANRKPTN